MITGLALINEVEDRLGWRQTASLDGDLRPDSRKMVRLLNRVLKSIQRLDDWPLLRKDAEITTVATLTDTNAMSVINGSKVVALGDADGDIVFSETMIGRALTIGSERTIYRIASVETNISLTMNKEWIGDTIDGDETAFKIGQDQYALPADFDRPAVGWESFLSPYALKPVGPDVFKKVRIDRSNTLRIGNPEIFTTYGYTPNNYQMVLHLDPYPESEQILNYSYYCNHPEIDSDNDRVLLPLAKLDAVIEGMNYVATRDYTDDQKMTLVLQDYMRALNSAGGSPGTTDDITQITPNMRQKYQRRAQWGRGVKVNWGSLFDRSDRVGFD